MTTEKRKTVQTSFYNDLEEVENLVYDKCGFNITNLKQNLESAAYGACSFGLNGKTIQYRVSKITPTKTGQFVTIWKKNNDGKTEPFDILDNFEFIIITSKRGDNFGQFIFPKSVLAENGIITRNGKLGKRGIRVYPPWDIASNKQAIKTQSWQVKYFLTILKKGLTDLAFAKKLLQ